MNKLEKILCALMVVVIVCVTAYIWSAYDDCDGVLVRTLFGLECMEQTK